MGKWYVVDSRDNHIFESSSDWCQYAAGPGFAAAIVERHNSDIGALTARAEAAEAKIAELQRRLDAVVEIFSHDENNPYNCIGRYELYDIAVAIAEGRNHE